MSVFRIRGGAPLHGSVAVPGSKNAALAILSAVLLGKGQFVLHNMPDVSDIRIKLKLLARYGAKVSWHEGTLFIDCTNIEYTEVEEELVRPIRTSFYIIGSLLARLHKAVLPAPGGCNIGARPVDYHIKGLQAMGVDIELENGVYRASAPVIRGAEIYFDFPSAGATQHLMATACLAEGCTIIQNAACEPEVIALANMLTLMGARIEGAGTPTITINGVKELTGCEFRVPADRIQASTYLLAGVITKGNVTVTGLIPDEQQALISKLREAEADCDEGHDWVSAGSSKPLKGIRVKTMPYPGFPTDMQQIMCAALTLAQGSSVIEETVYESRTGHVKELNRMGANIRIQGMSTTIDGVESLSGATVEASDLRAGAALVLAGLAANGETLIRNIHFIDRGYEKFEQTLRELGADIERVDAEAVEVEAQS